MRFYDDSIIAEMAWQSAQLDPDTTILDQYGAPIGDPGWNGLIYVRPDNLAAAGHEDLLQRFDAVYRLTEFQAWISTDATETCTLITWGHDEGLRSGTDVLDQAWNQARP